MLSLRQKTSVSAGAAAAEERPRPFRRCKVGEMFYEEFGDYIRHAGEAEKRARGCAGDLRKSWLRLALAWRDLAAQASRVHPQASLRPH